MKAIIIGGTRGFGKEITNNLSKKGYEVITIGRHKIPNLKTSYSCDVNDLDKLGKVILAIKKENPVIDLIACVAGFAEAKNPKDFTKKDYDETFRKNVGYVSLILKELTTNFENSIRPKLITIGSQWSYKTGLAELEPYILAKHKLRKLTKDYAIKHTKISSNHYCVPTMNTSQYNLVKKSFQKIGKEEVIKNFMDGELADYKIVAKNLIGLALRTKKTGTTFIISSNGKIKILNPDTKTSK